MKKLILIMLVLFSVTLLFGQNVQQKEAEVREMELIEAQALVQKDIETLKKVWSPGFMVNSPLNMVFTGGQVDMVQAGIIHYSSFVRVIENVMVLKDVVITMGSETVVPAGADPRAGQTIQRRYTNIWTKEKSDWVLMARHANEICVSAFGEIEMNRNPDDEIFNDLNFKVSQNPSRNNFYLNIPGKNVGKMNLHVFDSNGRLMEIIKVSEGTKVIPFGEDYHPGIYFLSVSFGADKKTIKLVKL